MKNPHISYVIVANPPGQPNTPQFFGPFPIMANAVLWAQDKLERQGFSWVAYPLTRPA